MATAAIKNKPLSLTWKGAEYPLVPSDDWDIEVLEGVEEGKLTAILRGILAGDGYARLRATKPKVTELTEFTDAAMKALGVSGN